MVDRITAEHGAVGVLINNAAYSLNGTVDETPLDEIRRQFETNVFGLVRLTQLVLPGMRDQGSGRIILMSSMFGHFATPGRGFYQATKHALEAIGDSLRLEVAVGDQGLDHRAVAHPRRLRPYHGGRPRAAVRRVGPLRRLLAVLRGLARSLPRAFLSAFLWYVHPPHRHRAGRACPAVQQHRQFSPAPGGQGDLPVDARGVAAGVALGYPAHADQRVSPAAQRQLLQVADLLSVPCLLRLEDPLL